MEKFILLLFIISPLLLISCGGVHETHINNCVNKVSIYSTKDLHFFAIKDNSKYKSYASLDIPDDEFYFCFTDQNKNSLNCCTEHSYLGFKAKLMPVNTRITFDGYVIKTVKWGVITINTGPSPTTWLRGRFDSGETIWISAHQLMRFFEREQNISLKNLKAYIQLRMEERVPYPIRFNSRKMPTAESMEKNFREQSNIESWDCSLK